MRHEPPASAVTGAPGAEGSDGTMVPSRTRPRGRLAGGLFGAITVVPALLAAAWLLPALPLLLAGRLSAPPLVFMFSPLAVGLCYVALRQLPTAWPGFRGERRPVPWWAVAATVAVAAGFAAWQIAERSQQIIVVRDPALYLQVGSWIAHHGSLPIPYSTQAFGGAHTGQSFASLGYDPTGSGLTPQLMVGLPLVLAAAIWLGGVPAALVATPLIGACAVLSFGGLAGRLVGARWAPAAAAALALSLPEQYTSRGTFSEPLAQVLIFGGLCLLIDALMVARQPAAGAPGALRGQDRVLGGLAGLILGLVVLVRIDGLIDILPAVPFLGVLLAARRRPAIPAGLGLVLGAGYGLAGGYLLSRPYLDREAPSLRLLGLIAAAVLAAALAGLAAARSRAVLARLRGWRTARPAARWLPAAAAAATVAVFAAFAVRPLVQKETGQYHQDSLYWVIWYIGLPAVLLGAFGLAALAQRGSRALLAGGYDPPRTARGGMTGADPGAEARTWALPLLIGLWVIVTVLWRPDIGPDQPWASSRLVPFVLPGLILGAIWASAWLGGLAGLGGQARTTSAVVASCCAASLLIPATLTNLNLDRHLRAHGMAFRRIGTGELGTVDRLCAQIGPDASVVILDAPTADRFAQITRGLCQTPTTVIEHPNRSSVGAVLSGIVLGAGRRPVLLAQADSELTPYGGGPRQVVNLATTLAARDLATPPTRAWSIQYTVWMSNPIALTGPARPDRGSGARHAT